MRSFLTATAGVVVIAFVIMPRLSSVRAQDNSDCLDRCFLQTQYPNSPYMTPEQQYQERQREYRERKNDEYYERDRQQRQLQQDLDRRRSDSYGAIAYSSESGDYGYSYGYGSRAEAEQRAKGECGKSDCEIAAWFQNSCGALAVGEDGNWAGGNGNSARRAAEDALNDCAKDGGKNCKILYSRCSR